MNYTSNCECFTENAFVKFDLQETSAKQLQRDNHSLPLMSNATTSLSAMVSFNGLLPIAGRPSAKYCVGKATYTSDFLALQDGTRPREIFDIVVVPLVDGSGEAGTIRRAIVPMVTDGHRWFDVQLPVDDEKDAGRFLVIA